jgi:hypothetical protein
MQVIIEKNEYEYPSDYDDGWQFSSGDDFKYPVKIDRYSCFIKRFVREPERVTGWGLLQGLKGISRPGLPRVYDIVPSEEDGKEVRYVFYECMKGDTLDNLIREGVVPDIGRLTDDLFKALASIHRHDHWLSDFCEKNIFCTKDGRFFLIDLDSAHPSSVPPNNDMYGNKEYWALVFSFFVQKAGLRDFKPADIPGPLFNYFQVVFLILRVRKALIDRSEDYKSTKLYDKLPNLLDSAVPEYRELFTQLLKNGNTDPDPAEIGQIKSLLLQKIVNGNPVPALASAPPPSVPGIKKPPVIHSFATDKRRLPKGGSFQLSWVMDNQQSIALFRNGLPYKDADKGARSMTLTEKYDGKDKKIVYTISASNETGIVNSQPVLVAVGPIPLPKTLILGIAAVLILGLLVFLVIKGASGGGGEIKKPEIANQAHVVSDTSTVKIPPPVVKDTAKNVIAAQQHKQDRIDSIRAAIIAKNNADRITKANEANNNKIALEQAAAARKATEDSTAAAKKRQAAEIENRKKAEKEALEKAALDSVTIIKGKYGTGVLHINRKTQLILQNLTNHTLDNVTVEITLEPGGKPETRLIRNIRAKSDTVLVDNLSKNSKIGGSVKSVHF